MIMAISAAKTDKDLVLFCLKRVFFWKIASNRHICCQTSQMCKLVKALISYASLDLSEGSFTIGWALIIRECSEMPNAFKMSSFNGRNVNICPGQSLLY